MTSRRRVSPTRLAALVALAAWASVFWFLLLTHRSSLYLSNRVSWTIPFGAVLLSLAAIAQLASLTSERAEPLRIRSALVLSAIVLPAAAIMVLPPTTLGAFAASRRSALDSSVAKQVVEKIAAQKPSSTFHVEITLAFIGAALRSPEAYASVQKLVEREGSAVEFVGIVTRPKGTAPNEFVLARFVISCCIADAVSVQVPVKGVPLGQLKPDDWVEVRGDVVFEGESLYVKASAVRRVPRPSSPYLWATS
jgi:uncharacterized repeat protein (TIGR03943 family)